MTPSHKLTRMANPIATTPGTRPKPRNIVTPAKSWAAPVVHWLTGSSRARYVQQEAEAVPRERRKSRGRMHKHLEVEMLGVERDDRIDITSDVPNADDYWG